MPANRDNHICRQFPPPAPHLRNAVYPFFTVFRIASSSRFPNACSLFSETSPALTEVIGNPIKTGLQGSIIMTLVRRQQSGQLGDLGQRQREKLIVHFPHVRFPSAGPAPDHGSGRMGQYFPLSHQFLRRVRIPMSLLQSLAVPPPLYISQFYTFVHLDLEFIA